MKISDVIIDMHQGINTVADKVEYLDDGIPIIQSKNFTKGYLDLEDVRYLGENDEKKYIDKYNPHIGDILMANIGTIGKSYVISEEQRFLIAWNAFLIKPNADKVKSEFLKFYFDYLASTHYFDGLLTGGTVKFINKKKIGDITIPDKSLVEQTDICDILSKIESVIIQRHQELELLDHLVKARFVELFGKPIDNTMDWPIDRADNLCVLVTDGSHFSPKACEEGYPMLSVKDMRQNGFDYSDCKLVDDETFEVLKKQGCVPQVDDVLIAKDGSYFTRAFAITEYKDQAILSSIGMYRPDLEKILPRFLASYLMTNEVVEFVNRGYVTGTALRRVIIKGLKNIPVYMPPIELQKEFVEFAKQVDKSKVAVQKSLDETQLLFDSLMQKYFG